MSKIFDSLLLVASYTSLPLLLQYKGLLNLIYKNVVYVNLETNLLVSSYLSDNISPERIIQCLEAYSNQKIIPGETLIIRRHYYIISL